MVVILNKNERSATEVSENQHPVTQGCACPGVNKGIRMKKDDAIEISS